MVIKMDENKPQRKPTRIKKYDYSSVGAYFVTLCTQNRNHILSEIVKTDNTHINITNNNIVGGDVLDAPINVRLLPYGKIAEKYIKQLQDYYDNVKINYYVIMPDHIHILLFVKNGASRTSPPTRQHSTLSRFVSTFKRFCNKEYGKNIWQDSFYDHIIRNKEDYDEHVKYIHDNPLKWYYKK